MATQTNDATAERSTAIQAPDARADQTAASIAAATEMITTEAGDATLRSVVGLQDAVLGLVRHGQDAVLAMSGLWTASNPPAGAAQGLGPSWALSGAGRAVSSGYDLFERRLSEQRRFVDRWIAQQRRFTEQLLTGPSRPDPAAGRPVRAAAPARR